MTEKRPNIILIMSDNHPATLLGSYGNDEIVSPNLDALAADGIQFNNAYCVNAMCSPCRASVLTGLMPSQHGIHTWLDDRIVDQWPEGWNAVDEFITLPEILKENGYNTALVGKYHLGIPDEPRNGFDHWVTFPSGHTSNFWGNTIIDNGETYTYEGHLVDGFTEKAVDYLNDYDSEKPFFMFLTYNGPYGHWPSISGKAKNRFAHLYDETPMHSIPREGLHPDAIARFLLRREASSKEIDYAAHLRMPNDLETLRNYFSQMTMVDDGVGRVMEALKENGYDEDTLVVYTCDHGFSLGHHGYWGHGQAMWPATAHQHSYHIPLIMRHPKGIQAGQTNDDMVSQIDYFATLLDCAGLADVDVNPNTPSRSFAPLLSGQTLDDYGDALFIEQEEVRAIRTCEWLYMARFQGSEKYSLTDELYNLADDPGEKVNLIGFSDYTKTASELRERIETYFNQYNNSKYDLWHGGSLKSNTDKPWLWHDAYGDDWKPVFG